MPTTTNPILIVDDEPTNLATLKQILGSDYPLVFARSGADCLAAVKKHQPALILLDIQMPDMDGYSVCRTLKADSLTESIPVIFVSALSEVGDETAGFDSGGVDYITKPVSPALVRARVRTHLSLVHATTLERYVKKLEVEQARTARLSRIHALLSGTNSAIVRIREPQALFEEACHVAVEEGGFGIAWIGTVKKNTRMLALTASQGVASDFLAKSLFLTANQELPESDITYQVLKTGKAIVCNNVRTIANCDRTCFDALNRGYQSLIALPLTVSEELTGVMVLYAREINFFDDEELKLLGELAGDISFALQSIVNKKRANFLSYYDALTELPNTTLFLDRVEQLIQAAQRTECLVCIIALNLNHFKHLNDSFGRHVGDQTLKAVAERLKTGLVQACSIARIGADNFALSCERETSEEISAFCEEVINLLSAPFIIDDQSLDVSARMGIAMFPDDADNGEALFKNAEIALKQTSNTKTSYLFYSPEINARLAEKFELEGMIKTALNEDQFILHFQPKVDLSTGKIVGAEALIRWIHPERGLVGPMEFIPLAEETGLIVPMGDWVIRTVCAQQAAWRRDQVPIVPIALNLSAMQFKESDVLGTVRAALDLHELEPNWLELELTETLVLQDLEEAEKTMRAFHELGLHLSLDDFGTGYSSLAYLKRFPFDTVKIDRAFVIDIISNPEDAAIASAIIGMAHSLRMDVVAEGVETEAQLMFLRTRHCNQIQGYFFSRPVPAENFRKMLCDDKHLTLQSNTDTRQQTLLIVDSEEQLAELMDALRGQGYRILTARSSSEALQLMATNSVQVVLCDQTSSNLIETDFFKIVAQLYPDTMRIVLSTYSGLKSILDIVNRGEISRFLTKPWSDDILRQNVKEAFHRYRPTIKNPPSVH